MYPPWLILPIFSTNWDQVSSLNLQGLEQTESPIMLTSLLELASRISSSGTSKVKMSSGSRLC